MFAAVRQELCQANMAHSGCQVCTCSESQLLAPADLRDACKDRLLALVERSLAILVHESFACDSSQAICP